MLTKSKRCDIIIKLSHESEDCEKKRERTGKEYTQREIAQAMGLSRSYISRIEKRGLEKIGKEMRKI